MVDDSFELYDLKVEVVCPPGEKIICGAKAGDYFTLQGEMLYLPAGQGISIYSLCKKSASFLWARPCFTIWTNNSRSSSLSFASRQTTEDSSEWLDVIRRIGRMSGSKLQISIENYKDGIEDFQSCWNNGCWVGGECIKVVG